VSGTWVVGRGIEGGREGGRGGERRGRGGRVHVVGLIAMVGGGRERRRQYAFGIFRFVSFHAGMLPYFSSTCVIFLVQRSRFCPEPIILLLEDERFASLIWYTDFGIDFGPMTMFPWHVKVTHP
jgi:hypothetical protein